MKFKALLAALIAGALATSASAGTIVVKDANGVNQTVGSLPLLGQAPLANSLPVAPASDWLLPAFAATPTFNIGTAPTLTVNLGTIAGVSTAANQATANTTLSNILTALQASVPLPVVGSGGASAPISQVQCDQVATYDASTSGLTQLVALSSSKAIYVCGYAITAASAVSVSLKYGTGTACATGTAAVTPAYNLTTVPFVDRAAFWQGMKTAASNALCLNTSGAVAVQATVYYSQF